MRALVLELVAVATGLLIAGAAAGPGGDRSLFVPPPEAAAANFVRAMATHRYPQAREHLASDLSGTDPRALAGLQQAIEQAQGPVERVKAEEARVRGPGEAAGRVSVWFPGSHRELDLPLRREKGLWKVASLDPLRALAGAGDRPRR